MIFWCTDIYSSTGHTQTVILVNDSVLTCFPVSFIQANPGLYLSYLCVRTVTLIVWYCQKQTIVISNIVLKVPSCNIDAITGTTVRCSSLLLTYEYLWSHTHSALLALHYLLFLCSATSINYYVIGSKPDQDYHSCVRV